MFMTDEHPFLYGDFTPKELHALKRLNRRHVVFAVSHEELKGLDKSKVLRFFDQQLNYQRLRNNLELAVTYKEPTRVIRKVNLNRRIKRLVVTTRKEK